MRITFNFLLEYLVLESGCVPSKTPIKCSYMALNSEKMTKGKGGNEGGREARGCAHFRPSLSYSGGISSPGPLHLLLFLSVLLVGFPQPHLALTSPRWEGHSQVVGPFVGCQELDPISHIPLTESRTVRLSARTCLTSSDNLLPVSSQAIPEYWQLVVF